MAIQHTNTSKICNTFSTQKAFRHFLYCKEKCADMNKKANNHNDSLHAEFKINICIQFTTIIILTNLNTYKYCLIQKIQNN